MSTTRKFFAPFSSKEASSAPDIAEFHASFNSCLHRTRTPQSVEVWGHDISEHYLVTFDPSRKNLLDIVFLDWSEPTFT